MGLLDKVKKLNSSLPTAGNKNNSFTGDIWHSFKDGDNNLRLVGEFIQVRQHYIAPSKQKKSRGLCIPEAFQGDGKIGVNINCSDWDIDTETEKKEKSCVICRLNKIAKFHLRKENKDKLTKDENDFFFALMSDTNPRNSLKWNVIDRDNPYCMQKVDGKEVKVLGYKIAQIGMEAWKDISGIFDQLGFDITDPVEGIDLIINKSNSGRVSYSAKAAMKGLTVKQTPLTEEEKALKLHDLRKICGKQTDQDKVLDSLHADLRSYIDEVEEAQSKGITAVASSAPMNAIKTAVVAPVTTKTTVTVPTPKVVTAKPAVVTAPKAAPVAQQEEPSDIADVQLEESDDAFGQYETEEETE